MTLSLKRGGQVGCHRRLADPALAGRHADHVLDPGKRATGKLGAAEARLQALLLLIAQNVKADSDLPGPLD